MRYIYNCQNSKTMSTELIASKIINWIELTTKKKWLIRSIFAETTAEDLFYLGEILLNPVYF